MKTGRVILLSALAAWTLAGPVPSLAGETPDPNQGGIFEAPPGHQWLSDTTIERLMKSVRESNPEKVKELERLRKSDFERFQRDLRNYARDEFSKIIREQIEARRKRRTEDFLKWLGEEFPKDAESLARLKEKDSKLYLTKLDLIMKQRSKIFEARENEELAAVLKEDYLLQLRRDELVRRIKETTDPKRRQKHVDQLEDVVAKRYDLIVRQKQIAYQDLLRRLASLQEEIKKRSDDIATWQDKEIKSDNVKRRLHELTEGIKGFTWN